MEIFVEEGKAVKRGQVLARLDDSQLRAMLNVDEAQLAAAQRAPPRTRRGSGRPS